jgi:peptide/nickel transport system permease protein
MAIDVGQPLQTIGEEEERVFIASQWQLMWWRFRRHKVAIFAAGVLLVFYMMAVGAEFLSTGDPQESNKFKQYLRPQQIRWFDDGFSPHVLAVTGERNLQTFLKEFIIHEDQKIPLKFFARGGTYDFLGIIPTDRHLLQLDPESEWIDESNHTDLYLLGTDRLGRDVWTRLMYASRISLTIGLVGVALGLVLGVSLGGISGFYGGLPDTIIQRIIEYLRSIPTIPLWLALASAVPRDWSIIRIYFAITIIISLLGWTTLAREVRGRFLAMREEDFVVAARLYGSSEIRLIFRHMLPSFMSHTIATTTLAVPAIIIAETSLSFLGLGLRAPAISWGTLLFEAQNLNAVANAPWLMIPGPFVLVAILGFNFMGDGLRDAADPYSIRR